jgi:hypothetical protein
MALERVERVPKLLLQRLDALNGTPYEMPEEIRKRALASQFIYDRIAVWQCPEEWYAGEKFAGTSIYAPESRVTRHKQNTPRGIVVNIGLAAMDAMRSNGIGVGHVVHFAVNAPYRKPLDDTDKIYLVLLHAGDLVGSEDLARALDDGSAQAVWDPEARQHRLIDTNGDSWTPRLPWMEV